MDSASALHTLALHDALPISPGRPRPRRSPTCSPPGPSAPGPRSEEHTSELQSRLHLVCRLLLEKKKARQKMAEAKLQLAKLKTPDTNNLTETNVVSQEYLSE